MCTRVSSLLITLLLIGCGEQRTPLFRLVSQEHSGITFENTVEEKDTINILTVQYMYHGGGVAIGDFNNDGLQDVFFTGNMVPNRLYLNRGGLKFQDVSAQAGIGAEKKWNSGVALADINLDGWLDIYVCATIHNDPSFRANTLFINQGPDKNGIPVFAEQGVQYGVADTGYSQNAAFLDFDKDGDLDLYVLTNLESDKIPSVYRPKITDGTALNNDRLYRNNGNNTFTDVTKEAGILIEGYGLGIGIADINDDGWPDIYVGNDYVSNDVLYINNRDGTFTNQIAQRLKHQSQFSMGVDIADINNDGFQDIITLDMLPENNLRRKTVAGAGATYYNYINNREYGYEFQYMRNMLQLNNGDGTFSEIGQMAGIHQTDWSWSSLLADLDNDGYRDLVITNGFPKDVTDRDYVMFKTETGAFNHQRSLIDSIPVLKIPNYAFKNNGGISFSDVTKNWGLDQPSFSHGAAFADLDNDGDLDYVVNNINDPAFVYENTLSVGSDKLAHNFLRINLIGDKKNPAGIGAKITISLANSKTQFHEHSIYRGYLSTVENTVHFGLGAAATIDSVLISWPDGNMQVLTGIGANQVITLNHQDATRDAPLTKKKINTLLRDVNQESGIIFRHKEWDKVDFYRQRTLPHKFSQAGPALAVGDINSDGKEDFIVGGSSLYDETLFVQQDNGTFLSASLVKTTDKKSEDSGLLLFDCDQDNDLDLYIVSGSYEIDAGAPAHQDRLYKNDGHGNFTIDDQALPPTLAGGSCVRAADFDGDGDLDLFVGGRVVPGAYPTAPQSYLLQNDHGKFSDVTEHVSPGLKNTGMVTDALWSDYDNDNKVDLFVVGEFMPVTIFRQQNGTLRKVERTGLENNIGWWNSITGCDFDKDGDTDYVVGNLGTNNYYNMSDEHPLTVYAKDFDSNESIDAILSCYFASENDELVEYPVHSWDELYAQSPKFRKQFSSFKRYGSTTMQGLLQPYDLTNMVTLRANYPYTAFAENQGNGTFVMTPLPWETQVSPINGIITTDVDQDGFSDIVMIGNDYGNEVFSGRYDACNGIVLKGNGKGQFSVLPPSLSGFKVSGDAKALAKLHLPDGALLIATQNLDSLRVFRVNSNPSFAFDPLPSDAWAELVYENGAREKYEFYHGSGYLSQATRKIRIPLGVKTLIVHDFAGRQRLVEVSESVTALHSAK